MIRAVGRNDRGSLTFIVGLGRENVDRLVAGEPIEFNLRRFDPTGKATEAFPDVDVVIAFDNGQLTAALIAKFADEHA